MKKRRVIITLLCFFIIFNVFSTLLITDYFASYKKLLGVTGRSLTGNIRLYVETDSLIVSIESPENQSYNFNAGDIYLIGLNTSASSEVESWWYTLEDLRHRTISAENIPFTPNATFSAVRWSNKLTAFANTSTGLVGNESVTFFVYVPNSAPTIDYTKPDVFVCEGNYLSYYFNATDVDEDTLTPDIQPKRPFYVFRSSILDENLTSFEVISGTLNKADAGGANQGNKTYEEMVYVSDDEYSDSSNVNITVIEINNAPSLNLGVSTAEIWTQGENSSFYKQAQVSDLEDGNQDSGVLSFNISFAGDKLFDIESNGSMTFTPNSSHLGVHSITVCVTDQALENPHQNISDYCQQTGTNRTTCSDFSLTVTNGNRNSTITNYYPSVLVYGINSTDSLVFNITKYDPDGTIPDTSWYVDNSLEETDSNSLVNDFSYNFGCGVSGEHTIKVEITDGLSNDSIQWNLTVESVACSAGRTGGDGGDGSGSGGSSWGCIEKWVCEDWEICESVDKALKKGEITGDNYRIISEKCLGNSFDKQICGFQTRVCYDLTYCNTTYTRPKTLEFCQYTHRPSCDDEIKNCHDGSCELLTDCGGPCEECPTCSDGIKNQGEKGVDCGEPCKPCEEIILKEKPFLGKLFEEAMKIPVLNQLIKPLAKIRHINYILSLSIILILILITLIRLKKVMRIRRYILGYEKRDKEEEKKRGKLNQNI